MSLSERTTAARLVAFGPPALAALVPLLDNADRTLADTAAYAIGCLGTRARPAIPALRRALAWNSRWAAHALAMTEDPQAIAELKEAAAAGHPAVTPLVLMGAAGQEAFVDVLRQTASTDAFYENNDLFTVATRVDLSKLVESLIAFAADAAKDPEHRRMACVLLSEIGGQAAPAVRPLEELAHDADEGVADRCAFAKGVIETTVASAHAPNTRGERLVIAAPLPAMVRQLTPGTVDSGRAAAWSENMQRALGRSYLLARIRPLEVEATARRVARVAEIGTTEHGYLMLDSTLAWPDARGDGPRRTTAEVFVALDSAQHVDDGNALLSWRWADAVSTFASVADYTFAVPEVEALVFVAGAIYDDRFLPLFIVDISREVAGRFRWSALDSKLLNKLLPPKDIGIATSRAKTTWKTSMLPLDLVE